MTSFIIPAHNEAALIGPTLKAIRTAAGSVGVPYELIVVDDASTDETARLAKRSALLSSVFLIGRSLRPGMSGRGGLKATFSFS